MMYHSFFVHKSIEAFALDFVTRHGQPGQRAMLFPSQNAARRCLDFMSLRAPADLAAQFSIMELSLNPSMTFSPILQQLSPRICAVLYPGEQGHPLAKQYWQHTGDGISSRRAEFCHSLFKEGLLIPTVAQKEPCAEALSRPLKGPKRYQRPGSIDGIASVATKAPAAPATATNGASESVESSRFLEERYGRNLDLSLVARAKSAIRRRIAGAVAGDVDAGGDVPSDMFTNSRGIHSLREDDIYLFPAGMNAIFNAHRTLLKAREPAKSINFGFPYVDTLKILQKFGPGAVFYGHGSDADLNDLETRCRSGERFLGLFCEFPGNPLLKCPDLARIRKLADEFDFALVVDETIGTFANINILPVADIVVSSLTKIFSGDSNVMGGCAILNPESRYYSSLKQAMDSVYEDNYWAEDVIFMERNSRDFLSRVTRINTNAEAVCEVLRQHPSVKDVFYPKYNPDRANYDAYRLPEGGYGGLLSVVFHNTDHARAFYDAMDIAKGPSLGTNFTLCSPYVVLAHYGELPWAAEYGVDPNLVRLSVGLEETSDLQAIFRRALAVTTNDAIST
jgi:cystathionine gamma-synthase